MTHPRPSRHAARRLAPARLALALLPMLAGAPAVAWAQEGETARPEVGKPLEAAQAAIRAKKFEDARKNLAKAEAVKGRSGYENFLIDQTRAVLDQNAGDQDAALRDFKELLDSGRAPQSEHARIEHTIATIAFDKKDWPTAADYAARAQKDGDKDPILNTLIAQAYYQAGDYKRAITETQSQIAVAKKANQPPTEAQLQLIANSASADHLNDQPLFLATMEQLALSHPSRDVWLTLVANVRKLPGINGRYPLDLFRFRQAAGLIDNAADYEEYAQTALAQGFPSEAKAVVTEATTKGLFGQGQDAQRQQKLVKYIDDKIATDAAGFDKAKADANDSHDGQGLFRIGYDLVTQGKPEGIDLIQQGIKKDNLPHPEDTKLRLGEAYVRLGKTQDALATFRAVGGTEGAKDVAHLWILKLQAPKTS